MTIRVHKVCRKLNQESSSAKSQGGWRVISKVTAVCAAAVCVCVSGFPLIVQAAPATLNSPEAAVYEQADEGSRTVGNLVEGSTFEYMGDVTAEDGNVWHQITTAGGTVGYIRGDREIETGEAEQSQEEEQTAAEQSPEVEQSQEEEQTAGEQSSHTEDNGGPAPVENVPEEGTEEPENAGTADGMEERPLNNQPKKYVLTDSAKIKERESLTKIDSGGGRMESKRTGADITLFFGAALIFFVPERHVSVMAG